MAIQICLLISDDLDDHVALSEALSAISENTVLLNIIDSQKASLLLTHPEFNPDYLVLDLSMHGIKVNSILKQVRNSQSKIRTPIILFGSPEAFSKIENKNDLLFFDKDYDFSELKAFLSKVLLKKP